MPGMAHAFYGFCAWRWSGRADPSGEMTGYRYGLKPRNARPRT